VTLDFLAFAVKGQTAKLNIQDREFLKLKFQGFATTGGAH